MNTNNNGDFLKETTSMLDSLFAKMNGDYYVSKFENLEIYKSIKSLPFFPTINNFFEQNFDILTKIFGILGIVGGIVGVAGIFQYFLLISFIISTYAIFSIVNFLGIIISALISLVQGFGLFNKKKWVPFLSIANFALSIILQFISVFVNFGFYGSNSILSIVITLLIGTFLLSIVINNKGKFIN